MFDPGFGPPMLDLEEGMILRVNSSEKVGTLIHKVKADDFSNTYVRFNISPKNLIRISDEGFITVASDLTEKVTNNYVPHKSTCKNLA